jgi:hypothetical protein
VSVALPNLTICKRLQKGNTFYLEVESLEAPYHSLLQNLGGRFWEPTSDFTVQQSLRIGLDIIANYSPLQVLGVEMCIQRGRVYKGRMSFYRL